MEITNSSVFILTCLFLGVNSVINGWLIHSGFVKSFQYVCGGRIAGGLLLVIPSILFFKTDYLFVQADQVASTGIISLLVVVAAWKFNKVRKRTDDDKRNYAYLQSSPGGLWFIIPEIICWVIYLLPYEFLLRGLLLPELVSYVNPMIAVLINSVVYALAHIQQGKREMLGALMFGILLCFVTLLTLNFWCAFIAHIALALTNSFIVSGKRQLTT